VERWVALGPPREDGAQSRTAVGERNDLGIPSLADRREAALDQRLNRGVSFCNRGEHLAGPVRGLDIAEFQMPQSCLHSMSCLYSSVLDRLQCWTGCSYKCSPGATITPNPFRNGGRSTRLACQPVGPMAMGEKIADGGSLFEGG
jgi:hypothetical protein